MVYGVRGKEAMNLWPGGEIVAGFDYDLTQLKNTQEAFDGSLAPNVWNFPNQELLAPYIALSQEFGAADGFHFIPSGGVRYYLHNEFDDKFSPQGGVVLGYAHTDLNFNYAKGVNYPSPVILQGLIQNNSSLYDFKDIKPEVVDHYELGLTHAWPGLATVGVTAFYDKGKDRVRTYFGGPAPSYFNYSANRYEIQGLELSGTVTPWPGLEFFAGFTWLDVEATGEDGIERDHMPYTPKYAVQAGFNWRFLKHLRLNVDTQFMSDVYQGTNMRTGGNYGDLGDQDKLDDIWLVNLRLGYSFEFKPMLVKQGEIYLAVDNLFDRDYAYASGYDMPGTTFMVGLDLNF